MRCDKFEKMLGHYMDDDLKAPDRDAMRRHLDVCTVCAALYAEHRLMGQRLRAAAASIPDPEENAEAFWDGLRGRLDPAPRAFVLPSVPRRAALPAVGFAAAILFGSLLWYSAGGSGANGEYIGGGSGERGETPAVAAVGDEGAGAEGGPASEDAPRQASTPPLLLRDTHSGLPVFPASPGAQWGGRDARAGQGASETVEVIWF